VQNSCKTAYFLIEAFPAFSGYSLSLRFNHEEFCDGVKPIAKLSRSRFLLAQTFLLRAG
jgi:hypothetical protein